MKVLKYSCSGEKAGEFDLPEGLFGQDVNLNCIHESIKSENLNRRLGNRKVKKRSEVSGGGKKPWAQKGTGNARQGSIRSPQWRGGGIVHGPGVMNFSSRINKKVKRKAILSVLSLKAKSQDIFVVDDLFMEKFSTNKISSLLGNIVGNSKCIRRKSFIVSGEDRIVRLSMRNIRNLTCVDSSRLSCMGLYYSDKIFVTVKAVENMYDLWFRGES